MIAPKIDPVWARLMPYSFTWLARRLKRSTSCACLPKIFTSSVPPILRVSFIIAFIEALASNCLRTMLRNRLLKSAATTAKKGATSMLIKVRRQSSVNITTSTAMDCTRLVTIEITLLVTAFCAPTTSLFSRLINSPTLLLVKKRNDMRCM